MPSGDVCFELFRLLQHQKSINYGKDNKTNVPVPVGKGLFSRELESRLIGLEKGEKKILTADGHAVEVEIVRISHTVLPELTDENVAAFGIDGVATVDDLRRYCIAKQVDGFLLEDENPDMASAFVWQEVAKRSRIQRDEQECARALERAKAKLAKLNEEMEDDGESGISQDMLNSMFLTELDLAAVGAELMARDGRKLTLDEYTAYIDKLTEAYPDRTRQQLERENGVETFALERYADYLAQTIDRYVAEAFKKALAK